ncbi:FGGY-family carbohydrate kinase [Halopenitus sp. H-Gu1]|uniref:FGGY-family carbohydrate kinase n=1 Tax=Halopenitus sp. H-Gu1 TaxID=3242697 RepID=UPI00359E958B
MSSYLLGLDAGLTRTKAVVFTSDGDVVAQGGRDTPVNRPEPDHREVDLESLWEAVASTIRTTLDDGDIDPTDVAAVGVSAHGHGLYALDADGEPVRPGIKSTDSRATDLLAEWKADGTAERIRERLGYAPFAGDPISLLAWLERHEPDAYDRIDRVLFCKDYLKYRLTDHVRTDEMEASVFENPRTDEYDSEALEAAGIGSCLDALPEVVESWKSCGEVTPAAADATGLAEGTPVASGLHDVGATALGTGTYGPGQGVLIVGTWGQSIVVLDEEMAATTGDADGSTDATAPGLTRRYLDGKRLRYKGNRSAAACVDWFVEEVGREWHERADREDVSRYTIYDRLVESVPAGAEGLLFHPYLDGSTDDPTDRGGFYGLTTEHTKEDMLRAVYEGVAISQAARLAELEPVEGLADVRLAGGGARSEVWSDVFAAALDRETIVPQGSEAGARGAAICAGIAAGIHPDHRTATDRMVDIDRRHDSDPATAAIYRERREIFETALDAIRPIWKRLSDTNRP